MARLIETDTFTNKDISAAVAIGAHTATATRMLHIRICVDQVAGGGDYIVYATLQIGGAGSHYRIIPITTAAAAAALTSIGFVGIGIPVDSGDVVTVYIDGLAGDVATPDTRVDFYEHDYLRPATADRTAIVDATGFVEANLKAIEGDLTSGNNATLKLKQLNVLNAAGAAIVGTGSTYGLVFTGTADAAVQLVGATIGADIQGGTIAAMRLQGDGPSVLRLSGLGYVPIGIQIEGVDTGIQINAGQGPTTVGEGVHITTVDGDGVLVEAAGAGHSGVSITGADNGIEATGTAGYGLVADGGTNETDIGLCDVWACATRTLTAFGSGANAFTYTVTDSGTGLPVEGVEVWITTDAAGTNIIWAGTTDTFGVARDANGDLPMLDAGNFYFWKQLIGYVDDQNPDLEAVP